LLSVAAPPYTYNRAPPKLIPIDSAEWVRHTHEVIRGTWTKCGFPAFKEMRRLAPSAVTIITGGARIKNLEPYQGAAVKVVDQKPRDNLRELTAEQPNPAAALNTALEPLVSKQVCRHCRKPIDPCGSKDSLRPEQVWSRTGARTQMGRPSIRKFGSVRMTEE